VRDKIIDGVRAMSCIPYFPRDEHAQRSIMEQVARFVDRPERMEWLTAAAISAMREWSGVADLRGLYCTRFKPADGHEADCRLPGFTADDNEAAYIEAKSRETERKMVEFGGFAHRQIEGTVIDVSVAIKPIDPPPRPRKTVNPVTIPATPKRTPEEHEAEVKRLAQAIGMAL